MPIDPSDAADLPELAEAIRVLVATVRAARSHASARGRKLSRDERKAVLAAGYDVVSAALAVVD